MLKAIIFDFNGVVIDDEFLHLKAYQEVMAERGHVFTDEAYYTRYLGQDDWGALGMLYSEFEGVTLEGDALDAVVEHKADVYERLAAGHDLVLSGVPELIVECASKVPLAICSGARRREIEGVLTSADLGRCFTAVVTADEMTNGKPDPEGYLKALGLLAAQIGGLTGADCLVLEDAPHGIEAARASGIGTVVGIASSRTPEELAMADLVVDATGELNFAQLAELAARAR